MSVCCHIWVHSGIAPKRLRAGLPNYVAGVPDHLAGVRKVLTALNDLVARRVVGSFEL